MKELKDLKLLDGSKIQALDAAGLKAEITRSEKTAYILRMKKETGELKQTHLMKFLRRYIAMLKMVAHTRGN